MAFKSEEGCGIGGTDKFSFTINVNCEENEDAPNYRVFSNLSFNEWECNANADFYGPEGCSLWTFEAEEMNRAISPIMPYLEIGIGILLTFVGNKFIYLIFTAVIWALSASIFLMITINFMKKEDSKSIILPFSCISALALAVWVSWYTYRYLQRYTMVFIGGVCG